MTQVQGLSLKQKLEAAKQAKGDDPLSAKAILFAEEVDNILWRERRKKASHLFPETEAEKERRLVAEGKRKFAHEEIPEEEEDYFEYAVRPLLNAVNEQLDKVVAVGERAASAVVGTVYKQPYISRAERKRRALYAMYDEEEAKQRVLRHEESIESSKRQQMIIQAALMMMERTKFAGHHRKADVSGLCRAAVHRVLVHRYPCSAAS